MIFYTENRGKPVESEKLTFAVGDVNSELECQTRPMAEKFSILDDLLEKNDLILIVNINQQVVRLNFTLGETTRRFDVSAKPTAIRPETRPRVSGLLYL